jgi:hypothetical protein
MFLYHLSWSLKSVVFFQYLLSSGKDSLVKLWELSTNRCLIVYTGAGATGKMEHRTQACFNHTEDYGMITITLKVVVFTAHKFYTFILLLAVRVIFREKSGKMYILPSTTFVAFWRGSLLCCFLTTWLFIGLID